MFREASIITNHNKIISYTVGNGGSVEFDFKSAWDSRNGDLRFYHTHPKGCLFYSDMDKQVMTGYSQALGRPILFYIVCFETEDFPNLDHNVELYRYVGNEIKPHVIHSIDRNILLFLKFLSFGKFEESQILHYRFEPIPDDEIRNDINLQSPAHYIFDSYKISNQLRNFNIQTLEDLVKKSETDLTRRRGVGKRSIQIIKNTLKKYGLSLRKETI